MSKEEAYLFGRYSDLYSIGLVLFYSYLIGVKGIERNKISS